MRVISQDGTVDVSYEMAVVYVECESVIAKVGDKRYVMGSYSTEKKAIKVMEMLREHYGLLSFMKFIAGTTKYESFIKRFTEEDFIKATTEYFQFPQDDEIEV